MLIYYADQNQFIEDVRHNRIAEIMYNSAMIGFSKYIGPSELAAWQNSIPRVRDVIEIAGITNTYVAFEYEVPYNQNRIDCLLFGSDGVNDNVILIELKQWSEVHAFPEEGNFSEESKIETYTGGGNKIVPHPSQQVRGYVNHLRGFVSEFESPNPLVLFSCSYCHNYKRKVDDSLFHPVYTKLIQDYPIYTREDTALLGERMRILLQNGKGFEIFNRFMTSPIRPAKKLLENVAKIISNESIFSLLNEQLVAKNLIWGKVRQAEKNNKRSVIIVHGGPGTGKSVIAINILAEAAIKLKRNKVFFGCKSKPFLEGLKDKVGREAELLFSNLYRFLPSKINEDELDLILIDEAHRIEKTSNHRFTRTQDKTNIPQIEQLIMCSKTSVFFIDDKQNVRSQEIGSSELIRNAANIYGRELYEITLQTQFRCMGSNDYLLWLEYVLGYSSERKLLSKNEVFDFKIFDTPQEIYDIIAQKEHQKVNSARMVAGFCWPWSKGLDSNGEFIKDVEIGDFSMPWETHGAVTKPPTGYVQWYEWGYKTEGVKQIGCIYTAQGFEYDYIGVIVGDDLVYDPLSDSLKADITATKDPTLKKSKENFEIHVKNIYRTLLSRGMKGCYVYFTNKETKLYFTKMIES